MLLADRFTGLQTRGPPLFGQTAQLQRAKESPVAASAKRQSPAAPTSMTSEDVGVLRDDFRHSEGADYDHDMTDVDTYLGMTSKTRKITITMMI